MNELKRGFSPFPMKTALATVAALAVLAAFANDGTEKEPSSFAGELGKRLSFNAYADVESAYICRGYVWDTRPYSAQYAGVNADLAPFGIVEPSVWTYSAMSPDGHSAAMRRYAYSEADYLLRWYYDIDIAEGWRLRNGLGRQWVTNPGFKGGHTVCDWQALQVLKTPWATPYWRVRLLHHPIDEVYWVMGVNRAFELMDKLTFTVDFFGDFGDSRHFANLYGPKRHHPHSSHRDGLQALNLVFRLDYRLMDHVSLFAFVGQFGIVSDDARDAVKALKAPEARRDLTYGGAGVSMDF